MFTPIKKYANPSRAMPAVEDASTGVQPCVGGEFGDSGIRGYVGDEGREDG